MLVGIIGNVNPKKVLDILGKTEKETTKIYEALGSSLKGHGIIMVPEGQLMTLARAYKKAGGKRFIGIVPTADKIWGWEHVKETAKECDERIEGMDWIRLPYDLTKKAEAFILLGFGTGSAMELNFIKYNYKFGKENKPVYAFTPLLDGGRLPRSIEYDIKDILTYFSKPDELRDLL